MGGTSISPIQSSNLLPGRILVNEYPHASPRVAGSSQTHRTAFLSEGSRVCNRLDWLRYTHPRRLVHVDGLVLVTYQSTSL